MYARDQKAIQDFISPGSDGWQDRAASAYVMVTFTIKTLTPSVLTHCRMFADGDMSKLYMTRKHSFECVMAGKHVDVFNRAYAAHHRRDLREALVILCELPGLGFAKAGFVMQLVFGEVGCIDTRNLKQFGVEAITFRASANREAQMRDAMGYVALCERLGGSEYLWDTWCIGVARQWPKSMQSADHVSRLHRLWLVNIHAGMERARQSR